MHDDPNMRPPSTVTQDDAEFITHLRIEAGPSRYNWLNGLVCQCVGMMSCENDRILIDAYHLTDFPGWCMFVQRSIMTLGAL